MRQKKAVVFILAFIIRLVALNQSLWLDEATTYKAASSPTFQSILTQFSRYDFHPPLYYFFMKIWLTLMGSSSEIVLRLPSVIFSLLAGYIVYRIGRLIARESTALWAAVFFLFNPLIIYYSQEARMYMMVTFFLTVATYFFIKIEKGDKKSFKKDLLWFNVFIFLSFASFYGSVFLIGAFLFCSFFKQKRLPLELLPGFLIALAILSPLLRLQVQNALVSVPTVLNWREVLGTATLKNGILIPLKFVTGRVSFEPKKIFFVVAGIWSLFMIILTLAGAVKNKMLFILLALTLILGIIFSFVTPVLQYFRFLYLIPLMVLLISLGSSPLSKGIVITGFALWSCLYLFLPQFYREDWRTLAATLPPYPLYMMTASADPVRYYDSHRTIHDLQILSQTQPLERSIVVVPYTTDIYGYDYVSRLQHDGYIKTKVVSVRGLQYEVWINNLPQFKQATVGTP